MFRDENYVLWVTDTQEGNPDATIKESLTSCKMDLRTIGSIYQTLLFGRKRYNFSCFSILKFI